MKVGIFQNERGEWIIGKDAQNGGVCDTKERAEELLALHNKYYGKQVSFDLGVGKVSEVGITSDTGERNLYIRFNNAKWKRTEAECQLI